MNNIEPEITVHILYFAHFGDIVGRTEETLALSRGATLGDLSAQLAERDRRMGELIGYGRASVNAEWATRETVLESGDEVAFMPPMSGG